MADKRKSLIVPLREVFSKWGYWIVSTVLALAVLVLAIWLPNLKLIMTTLLVSDLPMLDKLGIAVNFLGAIRTNFTLGSRILTIVISVLFGVNVSLLAYHARQKLRLEKSAGVSFGGLVGGFLGIGCASCGSVILSSIFGIGATAGFIGLLPFKGQEFGLFGVVALFYSSRSLLQKINKPDACNLQSKK